MRGSERHSKSTSKADLASRFSVLSWGKALAVGLCAVTIGVMVANWQGGSIAGTDFSWVNNSYAIEQAYDSTAFQVEEDSDSNNQVSEDDPSESLSDDPSQSGDGRFGNESSLSGTVVPSDDEVVIGTGGDAQGGNPSQGEGLS